MFGPLFVPRTIHGLGHSIIPPAKAPMNDQFPLAAALKSSGLPISIRTASREIAAGRVPGAVLIGKRWYCTGAQLRAALVHIPGKG
jgi:hypothetical protein